MGSSDCSDAARLSASSAEAMASCRDWRSAFAAAPAAGRSSAGSDPIPLRSCVSSPRLPRNETPPLVESLEAGDRVQALPAL